MNIEIDNYLLTTDKLNYIVNEKYEKRDKAGKQGKPTGEFAYREISYHGSIESALRKTLTLDLKSESIDSTRSLLETIERHREELETLYSNLSSVIREVSE